MVGKDGKRYGLPKDWDTMALFYNTAMTDAAGLTAEQMANLGMEPERRRQLRKGHRPPHR